MPFYNQPFSLVKVEICIGGDGGKYHPSHLGIVGMGKKEESLITLQEKRKRKPLRHSF